MIKIHAKSQFNQKQVTAKLNAPSLKLFLFQKINTLRDETMILTISVSASTKHRRDGMRRIAEVGCCETEWMIFFRLPRDFHLPTSQQ